VVAGLVVSECGGYSVQRIVVRRLVVMECRGTGNNSEVLVVREHRGCRAYYMETGSEEGQREREE
jgi:hypothetical protein